MKIHLPNRRVLISIIVVALLFVAGGYKWYVDTYHAVTFTLKTSPMTVSIKNNKDETIEVIKDDGSMTLANGEYTANPSGSNVDTTPVKFTVAGRDSIIVIDAGYAADYLASLLDQEIDAINSAIVTRYPRIINQYTIQRGELQQKGEWYVTNLVNKRSTNDSPKDVYKVILFKSNDTWTVQNQPEILPTVHNMPGVPNAVIENAYSVDPIE